jgi:CRP-like cAMP-binding protein
VTALEDAETFAVHRDDFDRLRRRHPSVNDVLFRYLVAEVHALNERLLEALYVPVEKRIVRRLLELGELYAGAGGGPPEIALTQEALADLAGTSRSTANEVLRAEERLGTIELQRGRIRLLDVDALQRRAAVGG